MESVADAMATSRDFVDSTLWSISEFERHRTRTGSGGFSRPDGPTLLPRELTAEFGKLNAGESGGDVLETIGACLRHGQAALLLLRRRQMVWPVTVFPGSDQLYHCPQDMLDPASLSELAMLHLIDVESAGVKDVEGVTSPDERRHYRSLSPLLWALALHGPRGTVLSEIGGTAAYRTVNNFEESGFVAAGALGSAARRLRRAPVSLREMSQWPGMSVERASRVLNACT